MFSWADQCSLRLRLRRSHNSIYPEFYQYSLPPLHVIQGEVTFLQKDFRTKIKELLPRFLSC